MKNFSLPDQPNPLAFPIAKAGYPLIYAAAFTTFVLALLNLTILTLFSLVITFFICWFFRDPDRMIPNTEKAVVSPADGKIVAAGKIDKSPYSEAPCVKVSVFMSIFNVHVNRIPYDGKVTDIFYHAGKFFSANLDKASESNERNAIFIQTEDDNKICVVQIAGLIARRIICGVQEGDSVRRGQRFGMICLGSRLDVYLPLTSELNVKVGDKVSAGSSILAYINPIQTGS